MAFFGGTAVDGTPQHVSCTICILRSSTLKRQEKFWFGGGANRLLTNNKGSLELWLQVLRAHSGQAFMPWILVLALPTRFYKDRRPSNHGMLLKNEQQANGWRRAGRDICFRLRGLLSWGSRGFAWFCRGHTAKHSWALDWNNLLCLSADPQDRPLIRPNAAVTYRHLWLQTSRVWCFCFVLCHSTGCLLETRLKICQTETAGHGAAPSGTAAAAASCDLECRCGAEVDIGGEFCVIFKAWLGATGYCASAPRSHFHI